MENVYKSSYVERWQHGKDLFVIVWGDLLDLKTLRNDILVGYHNLNLSVPGYFLVNVGKRTAFGNPVVPLLKLRKPQSCPFV